MAPPPAEAALPSLAPSASGWDGWEDDDSWAGVEPPTTPRRTPRRPSRRRTPTPSPPPGRSARPRSPISSPAPRRAPPVPAQPPREPHRRPHGRGTRAWDSPLAVGSPDGLVAGLNPAQAAAVTHAGAPCSSSPAPGAARPAS
ncbi:hypothetical protein [Actinomyces denticolens]|uniref:hypothetical protein n=1 Tax=Actinomyces denticolens TaxID=52767 RepID=UPI003FCD2CE1